MRRIVPLAFAVLLALPRIAAAEEAVLPHAWLYGAWTGGVFPPPTTLTTQECLANPTIIFTRDLVLHTTMLNIGYAQEAVDAVRATQDGVEFRLAGPVPSGLFGCGDAPSLRVRRGADKQISFPNCTEMPYPLLRCADR